MISGVWVFCQVGRAVRRSHQALSFGYSLRETPPHGNQGTIVPATGSARVILSLPKKVGYRANPQKTSGLLKFSVLSAQLFQDLLQVNRTSRGSMGL